MPDAYLKGDCLTSIHVCDTDLRLLICGFLPILCFVIILLTWQVFYLKVILIFGMVTFFSDMV